MPEQITVSGLSAYYGDFCALAEVSLGIDARAVTALIGPSGCGKSTFLRTLGRLHEVMPGARVEGAVRIGGEDIYAPGADAVPVRRRVGMVFQRPNPFPALTIKQNVLAGVLLHDRRLPYGDQDALAERVLREAGLWEEVRDRLDAPSSGLSGGQQQRLCIARAIAVRPEVLLMDEPCSALDPISTAAIEELITRLRPDYTIVIVTHNLHQATRVSQRTAFFSVAGTGAPGRLMEYSDTAALFSRPRLQATRDYIAGHLG